MKKLVSFIFLMGTVITAVADLDGDPYHISVRSLSHDQTVSGDVFLTCNGDQPWLRLELPTSQIRGHFSGSAYRSGKYECDIQAPLSLETRLVSIGTLSFMLQETRDDMSTFHVSEIHYQPSNQYRYTVEILPDRGLNVRINLQSTTKKS